jgi:hypothetical protein
VTPGVVCVAIVTAGAVVVAVALLVGYLAAAGVDPDPVIRLAAQVATGLGSLGTLALQLASRRTVAKTERNTGVMANALYEVADSLPTRLPARHAARDAASAADGS